MTKLKRPCAECPWRTDSARATVGFSGPESARDFIELAMSGAHHQCHMNNRQYCVCKGSKIFAAKLLGIDDGTLDLSVHVWTPDQLLDRARTTKAHDGSVAAVLECLSLGTPAPNI